MRASRLLLALTVVLNGCATGAYYAQAIKGHAALMANARPVGEVIDDPATTPALRAQLLRAGSIRDFASRELGLPDNGSYRAYAVLSRKYAVWNVVAAPEFSVEAVPSCFPVAGCVSYRGFFAQDAAEAYAAARRAGELDVHVRGVPAYSTLGWFDDPLLSTFIGYKDTQLARLIFHELAHQVVYVEDDSTFNESFAVVVEEAGVRRWLTQTGRDAALDEFLATQARRRAFIALIEDAGAQLTLLYAQPIGVDAMRARKRDAFDALANGYARLKARWGGFSGYDRFMDAPNNALLASIATYTKSAPAFRRLLAASGNDLPAFYRRIAKIAKLEPEDRAAALR